MKVGELAKQTGMSIRMLHHYDEIGLLRPSGRTEAGHRLYSGDDIERLQKVVSLRELGLSLEEVRNTLGDPAISILSVIDRHIDSVEAEIERKGSLLGRLLSTAKLLKAEERIDLDIILATIRDIVNYDNFLTPEQRKEIYARKLKMGKEKFDAVTMEIVDLIPRVREEMDKKTPPSSSHVQGLAKKWKELSQTLTGGDAELDNSMRKMYEQPGYENRYGVNLEMLHYIRDALESLKI